jgi:hypothetical protein
MTLDRIATGKHAHASITGHYVLGFARWPNTLGCASENCPLELPVTGPPCILRLPFSVAGDWHGFRSSSNRPLTTNCCAQKQALRPPLNRAHLRLRCFFGFSDAAGAFSRAPTLGDVTPNPLPQRASGRSRAGRFEPEKNTLRPETSPSAKDSSAPGLVATCCLDQPADPHHPLGLYASRSVRVALRASGPADQSRSSLAKWPNDPSLTADFCNKIGTFRT